MIFFPLIKIFFSSSTTSNLKMFQRSFRIAARSVLKPRAVARFNSTAVEPKIQEIVSAISVLTLKETSSLIKELKSQLDIPDMAFPVGGAAPAAAAPAAEEAEAEPAAAEKTVFNIKLESFDAKTKAKVIKEVKNMLGLSLVDSKKFVESAPKVLKENVAKEDAEKIQKTLEELGAKISLE